MYIWHSNIQLLLEAHLERLVFEKLPFSTVLLIAIDIESQMYINVDPLSLIQYKTNLYLDYGWINIDLWHWFNVKLTQMCM